MIIVNTISTSSTELGKPIYIAECPHCDERFSVCIYPKYVCSRCCMSIPDVLGITNATIIRLRYYFNQSSKRGVK